MMKKRVAEVKKKQLKDDRPGEELNKVSKWLDSNLRWSAHSPAGEDRYDSDETMDDPDPVTTGNVNLPKPVQQEPYQYSKKQNQIKCEWMDCAFQESKIEEFVLHVEKHVGQAEVRENQDKETLYCCLWESCGFDCADWGETARHITYHAYHSKLKALGAAVLGRGNLPGCCLDYAGRNLLPDLPSEFTCEWDECELNFNNFQRYLFHVHAHNWLLLKSSKYECLWMGCRKIFKSGGKLREHVRVHTQERMVGCPICGGRFTSRTRLVEHCRRQAPHDKKEFECSYCRRKYQSEALLRVHMRIHVNVHKCPHCEMTCPHPSVLSRHIRYRHMELRPFQCTFCSHKSKTERDLEQHQLSHCNENFWVCDKRRCNFECRSKGALQHHYLKNHMRSEPVYLCHICDNKYRRGNDLTKHIMKEHSYRWATGHNRFRYIQCEDGFFRLQTTRYHSIEVIKEIMNPKQAPPTSKTYECIADPSGRSLRVLEVGEVEKIGNEEEVVKKEVPGQVKRGDRFVNDKGLTSIDSDHSEDEDDINFGESLKKHLGLTDSSNFIQVVSDRESSSQPVRVRTVSSTAPTPKFTTKEFESPTLSNFLK